VEESERSREEMQGAAQQAKAADVQVKALQARLTQATEATSTIGKDLAHARTQVIIILILIIIIMMMMMMIIVIVIIIIITPSSS